MQTNQNGDVALKYYNQIQKYVKVGDSEYVFVVKANISMAWVRPEDVDKLLALKGGCNCPNNTNGKAFRHANEADVRRWSGISDR